MRSVERDIKWTVRFVIVMMAMVMTFTAVKADASAARISKSSISIYPGKSYTLKVKGASKVKWRSGNKAVAVVSSKGKVTGKKAGTTMVTATVGRQTLLCSVKVQQPIQKLSLSKKSLTLGIDETYRLKANILPSNASNKKLSWRSSNKDIAVVSSAGNVRAKRAGTVTITAATKDGTNKKASCRVTVKDTIQTTGISLNKQTASVQVGKTLALVSSVVPSNATNTAVRWTSSNSAVATVNDLGLVTGVAAGEVTITAATADGSNKKASCVVTVTAPEEVNPPAQGSAPQRLLATLAKYEAKLQADKAAGIRWHYYRGKANEGGRQYSQTFAEAVASNNRVSDCAILARWAMKEIGVIDRSTSFWWDPKKGGMVYGGKSKAKSKEDLYSSCYIIENVNKTPKQLEAEGILQPGDILCWTLNGSAGHMNIYAGNSQFYDSGKNQSTNTSQGGKIYFNTWMPETGWYMNTKAAMLIRVK